jgi:hypothetical protein
VRTSQRSNFAIEIGLILVAAVPEHRISTAMTGKADKAARQSRWQIHCRSQRATQFIGYSIDMRFSEQNDPRLQRPPIHPMLFDSLKHLERLSSLAQYSSQTTVRSSEEI